MVKAAGSASESGRPADLVVVQNLVRALALVATYLGLLKKQVEHSGGDRFGCAAASRQAARQGGIGRWPQRYRAPCASRPPVVRPRRLPVLTPAIVRQEGRGGWSARKRVEVTRRRSVQRCGAALHNPFGVQVCVTVVAGWDPS